MAEDRPISTAWTLISDLCAKLYGTPLPKHLLYFGSETTGWGGKLNNAYGEQDGITRFYCNVTFDGFPVALLGTYEGIFISGSRDKEGAAEDDLIAWLESETGET